MQGVISVVDRVDSLLVHDLVRKAKSQSPGSTAFLSEHDPVLQAGLTVQDHGFSAAA